MNPNDPISFYKHLWDLIPEINLYNEGLPNQDFSIFAQNSPQNKQIATKSSTTINTKTKEAKRNELKRKCKFRFLGMLLGSCGRCLRASLRTPWAHLWTTFCRERIKNFIKRKKNRWRERDETYVSLGTFSWVFNLLCFFFPLNLSYLGGLFVFIEREFVGEPQIARSDPGHLVGPHGITHLSLVPPKRLIVFKSSKNKRNDIYYRN